MDDKLWDSVYTLFFTAKMNCHYYARVIAGCDEYNSQLMITAVSFAAAFWVLVVATLVAKLFGSRIAPYLTTGLTLFTIALAAIGPTIMACRYFNNESHDHHLKLYAEWEALHKQTEALTEDCLNENGKLSEAEVKTEQDRLLKIKAGIDDQERGWTVDRKLLIDCWQLVTNEHHAKYHTSSDVAPATPKHGH